jgi:triosephosphate isomerase
MKRKPLIAGNWKMYLSVKKASALASAIAASCKDLVDRDVMVAPSFTALPAVAAALAGSPVQLAGQNVCWEEKGAFTGEISAPMLRDAGVSMVILGHSERRHIFKEDDQLVNTRLLGALRYNLIPVLCVGETLEQRESGKEFDIIENQVRKGLEGVSSEQAKKIIIAYEPVWAIGTGKTATKNQAQETHAFIRNVLENIYKKNVADSVRILYGGSVKAENVDDLMAEPDIDGALVGGAALKFESFDRIIHFIL